MTDTDFKAEQAAPSSMPAVYADGWKRGMQADPDRSANYIAHTMIGDPLADAMIDDLEPLGKEESERLIRLGMHDHEGDALRGAPASVREFFSHSVEPPDWLDLPSLLPGCEMFWRNGRLVLAGMVGGVLVEGFSTNIAKSFFLTDRLRDQGVRRLQQNNRHMVEIFMPGGMEAHADGWTHSVRIRLVHAKIRRLLTESGEWDVAELGTPISAAHVGFAIAAFSARLLRHLKRLGGSFDQEEHKSFMAVWRYSGYLMGVPETILYRDEEEALEIFRIGLLCEPPPSLESIVLATSLINSSPLIAGIDDDDERRNLASYVAQISRALIGDELADALRYPESRTFGSLWEFRAANRVERIMDRLRPGHVHAERSSRW